MGKSKFSLAPKWATIIVCLYLSFQTLAPLRHYLIPGNASLTGEGHLFSWRMMLVDRSYKARLKIMENGQVLGYISKRAWENYINFRQFKRICRQPQHIHRFAKFVYLEAKANNPKSNIEVYANLAVEINGRPFIQLIDSTIDLAAKPYSQFGLIDYMFEFPDIPPGSKTWLTPEEMDRWK